MSDDETGLADHIFEFDFQPGWIDLTLDEVDWIEAWAVATVVATREFDAAELTVKPRKVVRDLRRRAFHLSSDHANRAAAFYTPQGRALADLRLDTYGEDDKARPTPAETVPLLLDFANAEVVGEPDVCHLDLPVGPTARVQATVAPKPGFLGLRRRERRHFIKYAVFPPGVREVSVVWVTWERQEDTEEATRLADELMRTMRMVLVDDDGNPRELGGGD